MSCVERIKQKKQLLKFLSFHFANSARWRERQVYILTVDKLLEHRAIKPEMFNNYILKKLLELAADKIPNIRLCIAKCLSITLMENREFCLKFRTPQNVQLYFILAFYNNEFLDSKKHIQLQIMSLEKDPDRDVRDNVFSAFSEKEKTESPSSDDISEEASVTSHIEIVETPAAESDENKDAQAVNVEPTHSET